MRITEVEADNTADRLMALARFAVGRAEDTSAKMQMPVAAFIQRAQSMGIDITPDTLQSLVGQPPLNGIFNPMSPDAVELTFKGGDKPGPVKMPVNQAQDIVANAAQSALKKNRGV
jgi:hypothetical protein